MAANCQRFSQWWAATVAIMFASPTGAAAQETDTVLVNGPTLIAFYTRPASDSALEANPDLAAALDNLMYYWADTYPQLTELGISALTHAGRQITFSRGGGVTTFRAPADSSDVGYLLIDPDGRRQTLYRLHFPEELLAAARQFFGLQP